MISKYKYAPNKNYFLNNSKNRNREPLILQINEENKFTPISIKKKKERKKENKLF